MADLLPYFNAELSFLEKEGQAFRKHHQGRAERLSNAGDLLKDPHVERLVQSFAFLAARIHKRLDDDFPLVTESLLEVLYPQYLRPFPACSIAQFEIGAGATMMSKPIPIKRGTPLRSRSIGGVACQFTTRGSLSLSPLRLALAEWRPGTVPGLKDKLPKDTAGIFSIRLDITTDQARWSDLGLESVRVFLDGNEPLVAALRETLCHKAEAAYWQAEAQGDWVKLSDVLPRLAGFEPDDALLEHDLRTHPSYALLTEYFAFPEKFNFIDLPIHESIRQSSARSIVLHYAITGIGSDDDVAHQLDAASADNMRLHCVPVANLFNAPTKVRLEHTRTDYAVLPSDGKSPADYEVHSIERVHRTQTKAGGASEVQPFLPMFSFQHSDPVGADQPAARYWFTTYDTNLAAKAQGHETRISIIDSEFNPSEAQSETLSLDVLATNRDLPAKMPIRQSGGDLFTDGGSLAEQIVLLRKPTFTERRGRGKGALWKIVSHVSVNHLSLTSTGIDALREILALYDIAGVRRPGNALVRNGLKSISFSAKEAWLPGKPFATFVRGTAIQLVVDEHAYLASGLGLFVEILDRFFSQHAHINSFTQLTVLPELGSKALFECPRRTGTGQLL